MTRRRRPSTIAYGDGPPPHGFAAGRIWMAAFHPKADTTASLQPRPILQQMARDRQRRRRHEGCAHVARERGADLGAVDPHRRLDLGRVERQRRILRDRAAADHQRGREGPGLARHIRDIRNLDSRLLEQFARDRFLERFAGLDEARERREEARRKTALTPDEDARSEEHTSELQSLMRISYAVFCLKTKKKNN